MQDGGMVATLAKELETYAEHKDELLAQGEGKYVLIHDGEVVGVYVSEQDAINQGYRQFGNVPFLVKQIVQVDVPERFVSSLLKL